MGRKITEAIPIFDFGDRKLTGLVEHEDETSFLLNGVAVLHLTEDLEATTEDQRWRVRFENPTFATPLYLLYKQGLRGVGASSDPNLVAGYQQFREVIGAEVAS